jgi:hypothetical protein
MEFRVPSTVRMLLATVAASRVLLHAGHFADREWAEVHSRLGIVFARS